MNFTIKIWYLNWTDIFLFLREVQIYSNKFRSKYIIELNGECLFESKNEEKADTKEKSFYLKSI